MTLPESSCRSIRCDHGVASGKQINKLFGDGICLDWNWCFLVVASKSSTPITLGERESEEMHSIGLPLAHHKSAPI